MSVCYIFSGGVMCYNDLIAFDIPKPDYVICADAGYVYAEKFGYTADCLIGDFDTLNPPEEKSYKEILKYNSEKDDTDTMLAVKNALNKNATEIYIFGALGGRFDHTFANVQALNYISQNSSQGIIITENEYMTILNPGKYTFKKKNDFYFSVFSIADESTGVCLRGVKYTLENGTLSSNFPLGVSNIITDDFAEISFKNGKILIVMSKIQNLF